MHDCSVACELTGIPGHKSLFFLSFSLSHSPSFSVRLFSGEGGFGFTGFTAWSFLRAHVNFYLFCHCFL